MRAAIYEGPGNIRVIDVPDASVEVPTDAVVRVTHAAICGSDLWSYRGYGTRPPGTRMGHEFVGEVVDVGSDVRSVRRGDLVVAPAAFSDGVCEYCRRGLPSSCEDGGMFSEPGHDGAFGEAVRVPYADGTLVVVPPALLGVETKLLPLSEVLAAGHHAAVRGTIAAGCTVAVVGDGGVGLSAVLAARRLGADQIVAVGHHEERLALASQFGATEVVTAVGDEGLEEVMAATGGVDVVLECVGTQRSWETAMQVVRDGGTISYVGVPHHPGVELSRLFTRNVEVKGGICPVRAYLPELLTEVENGRLDASPIFDYAVSLDDVLDGFKAMDTRAALKVLVRP
jgi:threonine dehydrogenase-like Zn-dependent dehydrogenase